MFVVFVVVVVGGVFLFLNDYQISFKTEEKTQQLPFQDDPLPLVPTIPFLFFSSLPSSTPSFLPPNPIFFFFFFFFFFFSVGKGRGGGRGGETHNIADLRRTSTPAVSVPVSLPKRSLDDGEVVCLFVCLFVFVCLFGWLVVCLVLLGFPSFLSFSSSHPLSFPQKDALSSSAPYFSSMSVPIEMDNSQKEQPKKRPKKKRFMSTTPTMLSPLVRNHNKNHHMNHNKNHNNIEDYLSQ